jgi:hypothetical protein
LAQHFLFSSCWNGVAHSFPFRESEEDPYSLPLVFHNKEGHLGRRTLGLHSYLKNERYLFLGCFGHAISFIIINITSSEARFGRVGTYGPALSLMTCLTTTGCIFA